MPRDTYPGNTTSPTSQQTSVRVPSATSVNETCDEEEVFSSTEDVLEHSDVDEPNMEHLDSAGKNKPSNEQNLVQPLSPASVMVNDNDNGDEILDGLPNKTAERYNESVSSLVTDDAAQHAQVVNVPEETRLLGGLQVEHNDDDDDSLFEGKLKVMLHGTIFNAILLREKSIPYNMAINLLQQRCKNLKPVQSCTTILRQTLSLKIVPCHL